MIMYKSIQLGIIVFCVSLYNCANAQNKMDHTDANEKKHVQPGFNLIPKLGGYIGQFGGLCTGLELDYTFEDRTVIGLEYVFSVETFSNRSPQERYHMIGLPIGGFISSKNEKINYGFFAGPGLLFGNARTTKQESDPIVQIFTLGYSNQSYNSENFSKIGLLLKSDMKINTKNRFVYGVELNANINSRRSILMVLINLGVDLKPKAKPELK